jgi:MPBQ/MSBQ methyltransferase
MILDELPPSEVARRDTLVTYYTEATRDYEAWSRGFNMHFGYYRWGMNPLGRERMLEEMSEQVFERLHLANSGRVYDLGCGLGAPARQLARRAPVSVTGFSIVPWQIEHAIALTREAGFEGKVRFILGDYTRLPVADASADWAYSIEAACHDRGIEKAAFLEEVARVLRPGGRVVIADGFMKRRDPGPLWWRRALRIVTDHWALECFADIKAFTETMERAGLRVVAIEDVSWRIVPSILHIPWVTLRFITREIIGKRARLNRVRWGHVLASVASPIVGLPRSRFGYYLVTAEKKGP